MRCLNEISQPVQTCGRDLYGHLACLSQLAGVPAPERPSGAKPEELERQQVQAALEQLEVVRYALVQNLSRCFKHQV